MIEAPPPEGALDGGRSAQKGDVPRRIGRTKGGLNSKFHAVCDGAGKPIILLLSEGPLSDHRGARLVLSALPSSSTLIADRGYDSNRCLQRNLDSLNALARCRSMQDLVAVQSGLIRDNFEQTVDNSRRLAELVIQKSEEAARTITVQAEKTSG
jgi:hypothetical protein